MLATDPTPVPTSAGLGPRPVGDPDAMRALAARLRREAARLARHQSLDLHAWRSERATEVRHQLEDYARTVRRESDQLDGLANELVIEADHVQTLQIDWTARKVVADAKHSSIPASKT